MLANNTNFMTSNWIVDPHMDFEAKAPMDQLNGQHYAKREDKKCHDMKKKSVIKCVWNHYDEQAACFEHGGHLMVAYCI